MILYISKAEYILLKKIKKSDGLAVSGEMPDTLLEKGFVKHKHSKLNRDGGYGNSPELVLTNNGVIAYENYEDYKSANSRSWASVFISILSLIMSLISLYNSVL